MPVDHLTREGVKAELIGILQGLHRVAIGSGFGDWRTLVGLVKEENS